MQNRAHRGAPIFAVAIFAPRDYNGHTQGHCPAVSAIAAAAPSFVFQNILYISGLSEVWYRAWFGRLTDSYKLVKISNAKPVGTLSKFLFTPLIFRSLSGSMTTYLTTIGTKIFLRAISNNQISGCGPVGRALDLGSRRREFESPHSDHKGTVAMIQIATVPF